MKKLFILIILFCSLSLAQGWNTTITTSINEPYLDKMDLIANASGIHVLIKRANGYIVYYRLDSQGNLETSSNPSPWVTNGDFPNIVASNDKVYALYKAGSNIKGKYSTNGGTSWSNLPDRATTTNL